MNQWELKIFTISKVHNISETLNINMVDLKNRKCWFWYEELCLTKHIYFMNHVLAGGDGCEFISVSLLQFFVHFGFT
jgi:hypothetical protein